MNAACHLAVLVLLTNFSLMAQTMNVGVAANVGTLIKRIPAIKPIEFRELSFTNTTDAASSYSNSVIALPSPRALLLTVVVATHATFPHKPSSITGHGLTWDEVYYTNCSSVAAPGIGMTLYRALGTEPNTNTVMVFFGGTNMTGCSIYTCEFQNVSTSGSNGSGAIAYWDSTAVDSIADPVIDISPLSGSTNAVFACLANNKNTFSATPGENRIEDLDTGFSSPTTGIYVCHELATTDGTIQIVKAVASDWCMIALEIQSGR